MKRAEVNVANSSSGHVVNGDKRLSGLDRIRWLVLNWRNNSRAMQDLDPSLDVSHYQWKDIDTLWERVDKKASPSRRLSDLFWLSLPWYEISRELNQSVTALEVGCGSGRYGAMIEACIGSAFNGYIGLDVNPHPDWSQKSSDRKMKFICADAAHTKDYLGDANLIFTQSALEHFEEDLLFFRQVSEYIATSNRPVMQIHLMPSASCWTTFPWHGVREYTPRTLSRITRLFGRETSRRLYYLGSSACNRVHRRYITYPWLCGRADRRHSSAAAYDRDVRGAVRQDAISPGPSEASFLALVLQSHFNGDVFSRWERS